MSLSGAGRGPGPVLDRLGDVFRLDVFHAFDVRDRARNLQDPVVGTSG